MAVAGTQCSGMPVLLRRYVNIWNSPSQTLLPEPRFQEVTEAFTLLTAQNIPGSCRNVAEDPRPNINPNINPNICKVDLSIVQ